MYLNLHLNLKKIFKMFFALVFHTRFNLQVVFARADTFQIDATVTEFAIQYYHLTRRSRLRTTRLCILK